MLDPHYQMRHITNCFEPRRVIRTNDIYGSDNLIGYPEFAPFEIRFDTQFSYKTLASDLDI